MPISGCFEDQHHLFVDTFPVFVEKWRERNYQKVWNDVSDFTQSTLKAVFGKK